MCRHSEVKDRTLPHFLSLTVILSFSSLSNVIIQIRVRFTFTKESRRAVLFMKDRCGVWWACVIHIVNIQTHMLSSSMHWRREIVWIFLLIHLFFCSFIHLFYICFFAHSFIDTFINWSDCFHLFVYLFICLSVFLLHSFIHFLSHWFICLFIREFVRLFVHSRVRLLIHSWVGLFVHSFIHSFMSWSVSQFIHSWIGLLVHSFIHELVC